MMVVKIKNIHLGQAIDLLFNLSLKGKRSRHRTKFVKLLSNRLQEVGEQEKELLKEHCHLDEDGNPKTTNEGQNWDVKDPILFGKDRKELYEEEFVIDGGDMQETLKTVKEILFNCDVEFSGQEAVFYDYLCEQFEQDSKKKEGEDE